MAELTQVVMSFSVHPSYVAPDIQGPLSNEDLGLIWLDWVKKLNAQMLANYDLVLLIPQKTVVEPEVLSPWKSVKRFNENSGIAAWPRGPNAVFQQIMWFYYHEKLKGPFLWCEPDCVPVKFDWLDRIRQEYAACGKDFMGTMVEPLISGGKRVPRHMTGNAVYPHKAYEKAPKIMEAVGVGWDVLAAEQILPRAHITKLIQHEFRHAQFKSRAELEKALKPETVLFHSDKYGAIAGLLGAEQPIEDELPTMTYALVDQQQDKHGLAWYRLSEILEHLRKEAEASAEARELILSFLDGYKAEWRRQKAMQDFQRLMNQGSNALATLNG